MHFVMSILDEKIIEIKFSFHTRLSVVPVWEESTDASAFNKLDHDNRQSITTGVQRIAIPTTGVQRTNTIDNENRLMLQ
ncbi:hypothetical protein L1887_16748 [Cichorium endivia]|nr:hypothetical protein L1887_16748 [Cichorium endivia]